MASPWRIESERVCREAIKDLPLGTPEKELKAAMSARYPFGERAYMPYKIWLGVVKRTLATRALQERWAKTETPCKN